MNYALLIESKEVDTLSGCLTAQGDRFWIVKKDGYFLEVKDCVSKDVAPHDAMLFASKKEAKRFFKAWKGYPWWVVPTGNFDVVEVVPKYKQVVDCYIKVEDKDGVAPT